MCFSEFNPTKWPMMCLHTTHLPSSTTEQHYPSFPPLLQPGLAQKVSFWCKDDSQRRLTTALTFFFFWSLDNWFELVSGYLHSSCCSRPWHFLSASSVTAVFRCRTMLLQVQYVWCILSCENTMWWLLLYYYFTTPFSVSEMLLDFQFSLPIAVSVTMP